MAHDPEHDCSHLREALGEYLDGEIDSDLCRELHEHLKGCERCRVVVDTTRRTIRFYSGERPFRLPEGMLERLRQRLSRMPPWRTDLPP